MTLSRLRTSTFSRLINRINGYINIYFTYEILKKELVNFSFPYYKTNPELTLKI